MSNVGKAVLVVPIFSLIMLSQAQAQDQDKVTNQIVEDNPHATHVAKKKTKKVKKLQSAVILIMLDAVKKLL